MSKMYDSTEALQAAWELANQGFGRPTVVLNTNPINDNVMEVWLFCSPRADGEYPEILIDEVASWAIPRGRIPHITGICDGHDYWWVFD